MPAGPYLRSAANAVALQVLLSPAQLLTNRFPTERPGAKHTNLSHLRVCSSQLVLQPRDLLLQLALHGLAGNGVEHRHHLRSIGEAVAPALELTGSSIEKQDRP